MANYNKTRINIGHQHDRWMELEEALRVQTHAEVAEKLHHKCNHECHCACSSEIGTCIINDAGRRAAHKKQPNLQQTKIIQEYSYLSKYIQWTRYLLYF